MCLLHSLPFAHQPKVAWIVKCRCRAPFGLWLKVVQILGKMDQDSKFVSKTTPPSSCLLPPEMTCWIGKCLLLGSLLPSPPQEPKGRRKWNPWHRVDIREKQRENRSKGSSLRPLMRTLGRQKMCVSVVPARNLEDFSPQIGAFQPGTNMLLGDIWSYLGIVLIVTTRGGAPAT